MGARASFPLSCSFSAVVPNVLYFLAICAGVTLSVMSLLHICSDACSEAAKFSFFGAPFGWFGTAFFSALLLTLFLKNKYSWADVLFALLLFAAAGAESRLIWLQKYVIGVWCPTCLGIAAAVFAAGGIMLFEKVRSLRAGGGTMRNYLKHASIMLAAFAVGLSVAVIGVNKEAESATINPFLGKTDSAVTVYFISDWFCPGCRKIEPDIERMYPDVAKMAKVGFIDYPIHPETSNFTPYNLQFLVYEKDKYIKLRKALEGLALKTKAPSQDDVQAAVAPLGVKLRQINYADVMYGMQLNLTTYRGYGVNTTPAVVVANGKNNKSKVFEGTGQITWQAVRSAITEVSK